MELTKRELSLISIGLLKVADELHESERHQDVYKEVEALLNKVDKEIVKALNTEYEN